MHGICVVVVVVVVVQRTRVACSTPASETFINMCVSLGITDACL